jgi:hypothetical protein
VSAPGAGGGNSPIRSFKSVLFHRAVPQAAGRSRRQPLIRASRRARGEPLRHWTVHDLRRSASTLTADRLSVLPHIVEAILDHVRGHRAGVAGMYNRARCAAEMRKALESWTEHVAALPDHQARGGSVGAKCRRVHFMESKFCPFRANSYSPRQVAFRLQPDWTKAATPDARHYFFPRKNSRSSSKMCRRNRVTALVRG